MEDNFTLCQGVSVGGAEKLSQKLRGYHEFVRQTKRANTVRPYIYGI